MQFIEKNSFNVRSAIYRLKRDRDDFEFHLFPMIHIGTMEYYREVGQRIAKCDLLLIEGVQSKRVHFLTLSYERLLKASDKAKSIGIVYGAEHMRSITAYLLKKQGYRITDSEWITVFDI